MRALTSPDLCSPWYRLGLGQVFQGTGDHCGLVQCAAGAGFCRAEMNFVKKREWIWARTESEPVQKAGPGHSAVSPSCGQRPVLQPGDSRAENPEISSPAPLSTHNLAVLAKHQISQPTLALGWGYPQHVLFSLLAFVVNHPYGVSLLPFLGHPPSPGMPLGKATQMLSDLSLCCRGSASAGTDSGIRKIKH